MQVLWDWYSHRAKAVSQSREMAVQAKNDAVARTHGFEQAVGERKTAIAG
jgi:hypothetical protein